ncbi:putative NADPH-cytochrome p450 reductase [Cryptosporidium canis]|uniref:NADPH--hemoprotein reductase n=1 Tax=Cryptosporidium canis TaxID=195482 RepID=A0ABQ8P5E5_9CRYT|nr:putative NADPH-cytochrome p450 reductase [Cryptosporidium canis]KAJ1613409.1 putative NADPH-cytochrome p450 reductase [Cryptosporidium canis]
MLILNKSLSYLSLCNIFAGLYLVLRRLVYHGRECMDNNKLPRFTIFYSTETGNSRMISELFNKLLVDKGINTSVHEINSMFERNNEPINMDEVLVFVISTCGNGNFPSSSRKYIRYLSKMLKSGNEIFSGIKYTIIGLGSSVYEYTFNLAANKLDRLISLLGGEKFCEIALLDEVNGNELDFRLWWNNTFLHKLGITNNDFSSNNDYYFVEAIKKHEFICELKSKDELNACNYVFSGNCHISESYFKLSEFYPINREVLCESKIDENFSRQIFNLQLRVPGNLIYNTFDIIDVLPPNPDENINFFLQKVLGIQDIDQLKNIVVNFLPANSIVEDINVPFPNHHSLIHIMRYFFDLTTLPPHDKIMQFVPYLNKIEGEQISNENFFHENKERYKFSFHLFVDHFMKSLVPIPIQEFIRFSGIRQRLRSYSISSSSLSSPSIIDLTICTCLKGCAPAIHGEAKDNKNNTRYIKGLCSSFLFEFDLKTPIFGMIRPSSLNINTTSPILMFSHGSGIAPIRALLHERKYLLSNGEIKTINPAYFFYGCKTENEMIYRDELHELKATGALSDVFFALSKSNNQHVGDLIHIHKELVLNIINQDDSIIYICGKHEFCSGVKSSIMSTISGGCSKDVVKNLFLKGRIYMESWN